LATAGTGQSLIGDQLDVRVGDIGEGLSGGAGVGAGHVGHAVVENTFLNVDRIVMGGGTGGFGAAPLIDGDVDENAAGTHAAEHGAGDELGGFRSGDENRADEEINVGQEFIEVSLIGKEGVGGVHGDVEEAHPFEVHLENGDISAQSGGHAGGIDPRGAAPDDDHPTGQDPGDPPQENATPAPVFGQKVGTDNHGHASGDFGHRL